MTSRTEDMKAPLARLSRVNVFKPRVHKDKSKFEVNLIFPKTTNLDAIKAAIMEAAKAEWGEKAVESLKKGLIKQPILDGDGPQGTSKKTEEQYPELAGMYFIRCASNLQPKLFSRSKQPAEEGVDLYSGCFGYAVIHAYTWENAENGKGVSIGLSMLQMVRDGTRLGGADADPDKFFDTIPEGEDGDVAGAATAAAVAGGEGAGALFS